LNVHASGFFDLVLYSQCLLQCFVGAALCCQTIEMVAFSGCV
jgi:hypothetical protein